MQDAVCKLSKYIIGPDKETLYESEIAIIFCQ